MSKKITLLIAIIFNINFLHSTEYERNNTLRKIIITHPDTPEIDAQIEMYKDAINPDCFYDWDPALVTAVFCRKEHAVTSLLKHGARIHRTSRIGETALHRACFDRSACIGYPASFEDPVTDPEKLFRIVAILLKNGADINAQDEQLRTPFSRLVWTAKDLKLLELALAYGADINLVDIHEMRPIDNLIHDIRFYKNYARHCNKKKETLAKIRLDEKRRQWLALAHYWKGKSPLRHDFIALCVRVQRDIYATSNLAEPVAPGLHIPAPNINTCTAIIPYAPATTIISARAASRLAQNNTIRQKSCCEIS